MVLILFSGAVFALAWTLYFPADTTRPQASVRAKEEMLRDRARTHLLAAVEKDLGAPGPVRISDTRYFTSDLLFADGTRAPIGHTLCGAAQREQAAETAPVRRFVATVIVSPMDAVISNDSLLISWDDPAKEKTGCKDNVRSFAP